MASTNYFNLFIEVAEDTKATSGTVPPVKGSKKTVANYEYEMVSENPYKFTSDDVFFKVYAERNGIPSSELEKERELYPTFRMSQKALLAI